MEAETALAWVDQLITFKTGKQLNALQRDILARVLRGQKYPEIAAHSGYTEGHIKDVSAHLWKVLSGLLGERITKSTCRVVLERYLHKQSGASTTVLPALPPHTPAETLLGREAAIAHLDHLVQQGCKVIVIQGEGGLGKTTLAQHYLQTQGFETVLELLMAKETSNITSVERIVEEWLKQDFQQEPGTELGISLGRLKRQLHQRRIGILIDNLEPVLDAEGRFISPHRSYVELLRVLSDARVQSVTLITSRDRLCEPDLAVKHYKLPRLDLAAWQTFFSRQMTIDPLTLGQIHRAYRGNAKAMGILCGAIAEDFQGDMAAYWQENQQNLLATRDLRNLVISQIDRLQALDPAAYRLLCRLGCYRYQEMPAVPSEGVLCLLWDVPPDQRRQVVTALRDRSLVECEQGKYWLHPTIQAEAIVRLRASLDWEISHRKAAQFWTSQVLTIETVQDALQALEAHYHYIEIGDFEAAGSVVLKSRTNQWQQFLPLGSTLYRMGLLQPVLAAIVQVIPHIQSPPKLSELYNILGDLYWIRGRISEAIACQEKTISLVEAAQQKLSSATQNQHTVYYLRMLQVDSLLSIGLYQMDLWELEVAARLFQQVIDLAQNTAHHPWAEKASVCLALAHSYLGQFDTADSLAETAYQFILTQKVIEQTGRFAYFIQILGQTYTNLHKFERAQAMYDRALAFAGASHYTQVKAKTLNGLAEFCRQQHDLDSALSYHQQAIALLETIGAVCDLANAYFQLGLTYRAIGQLQQCQKSFEQALRLFGQMQATKQIEKVQFQIQSR
ncbi:tetratricopeptide repeat protein [Leptolyngbya sp. FACHB-8]|uniref:tetratricopeptide repeat protein n=1 Tax=unclassified Leptolyngbya TaxID=2650499 RepID=UPI001685C534|nr:tetratricopeptide repeat protein [Leptolyngbya sp. FACHB-8]MBD1912404.1 tetratricopeptide repeat protein [Leptolyngbya sp. FACHB-8]